MRDYIVKRLLIGVLLLITVSILVFCMLYWMPGDPVLMMAGQLAKSSDLAGLRHQYGLDRPMIVQYFSWVDNMLHGDFGISYKYRLPVWSLLKSRIPISLNLTVISMIVEYIIAVPLGLLCAFKKNSLFDKITVNVSLVMVAIPSFWLAVLLILVFGVKLEWLPISGYEDWTNYILPIVTGALGGVAVTLRLVKSEAIDALHEKYVITAYAKGVSERNVLVKHVLRNSLIVVTVNVFMSIPWLISGFIVIEKIFGIPGMGNLMIESIVKQDFNVIQAIIMIITLLTVVCNILSDIVLGLLDPRIRISVTGGDN